MGRMASLFPYFAQGTVVKGFGRGSKELGIPTANFPDTVVERLPKDFENGIYYGWAGVSDDTVYPMVMSVGWNPFYHNTKRTMETHIIHKFSDDFYGAMLKICILGYIRPEKNFDSVDALIEAIHSDIQQAQTLLQQPQSMSMMTDAFFQPNHRL